MENNNIPFFNDKVCRIKRTDNSLFAKPIGFKNRSAVQNFMKSGINSKEAVSNDKWHELVEDWGRDSFDEYGVDRWEFYRSGELDPGSLSPILFIEYCIDEHLGVWLIIREILSDVGYKFRKKEDLKKYLFIKLRNTGDYSDEQCKYSISYYFNKSDKSLKERRARFLNKAFANQEIWNRFGTFTYNSELMDEEKFAKKLKKYLQNLSSNYGVKYMGAFERSPVGRLHFHCIMSIPDGLIDRLCIKEEKYYNKSKGEVDIAYVSQDLKTKFGRCDFQPLNPYDDSFLQVLTYTCKYIQKQNNPIVYCRGVRGEYLGIIPSFNSGVLGFISPMSTFYLMDNDIVDKVQRL